MEDSVKQFQERLVEVEIEAENLLLARHQVVKEQVNNINYSLSKQVLSYDNNCECSWLKTIE